MLFIFFFNDTATTEIYTLSLHDALPIFSKNHFSSPSGRWSIVLLISSWGSTLRSEERFNRNAETDLVCRLLLEKKNENDCNDDIGHKLIPRAQPILNTHNATKYNKPLRKPRC